MPLGRNHSKLLPPPNLQHTICAKYNSLSLYKIIHFIRTFFKFFLAVSIDKNRRFNSGHRKLSVLPKDVITKLKLLKEMHTVAKNSEDSETAFYIYFLIYNKTKNKQLPISKLLALNFSF